jgi:hypothetical protein
VLAELRLERVWEVHPAGGEELDGYWLDAHSRLRGARGRATLRSPWRTEGRSAVSALPYCQSRAGVGAGSPVVAVG